MSISVAHTEVEVGKEKVRLEQAEGIVDGHR